MTNPKYAPEKGEDWYYEQHVEQGRSVADIAHDVDVGPTGVRRRLESYGFLRTEQPSYPELRDPEWLREQYVDNFRTLADIADELGCCPDTVSHWLDMYSIPRRSKPDYVSYPPVRYKHTARGHPMWQVNDGGELHTIRVHRLLAVALYGLDAVRGRYVRFSNSIPWDNRPDNIRVRTPEEPLNDYRSGQEADS